MHHISQSSFSFFPFSKCVYLGWKLYEDLISELRKNISLKKYLNPNNPDIYLTNITKICVVTK